MAGEPNKEPIFFVLFILYNVEHDILLLSIGFVFF